MASLSQLYALRLMTNNEKYFNGPLIPAYEWNFIITHIRDADSYRGIWDKGGNKFIGTIDPKDYKGKQDCRQYGYNANEITMSKSKKRGAAHVKIGYDQRDAFMKMLDLNPEDYPRKAIWHRIPWKKVLIKTIKNETGKYGRLKTITYNKGFNTNEAMRDLVGGVEFYDGKIYPPDYPIRG